MDDVIYRQAAIDVLSQYPFEKVINCLSILEELPSAQPRWIPCSDRLPEKHQMVITTIIGTDVIRMSPGETFEDALAQVRSHVRVSVGYIADDGWYGADGFPQIVQPIAWMPMPEPYREAVDD